MTSERNLQNNILLTTSSECTLFRNNVGVGWAGKKATCIHTTRMVQVSPGDVVIRQARPLHAGLHKGSSDLIGWTPIVIAPNMVGETIAVFTGIEVKGPRTRVTVEQSNFVDRVVAAGGRAGIARSIADAIGIIRA